MGERLEHYENHGKHSSKPLKNCLNCVVFHCGQLTISSLGVIHFECSYFHGNCRKSPLLLIFMIFSDCRQNSNHLGLILCKQQGLYRKVVLIEQVITSIDLIEPETLRPNTEV